MIRLSIAALQLAELFVSSLVHLLYGFYIFSTALAGDLSQALSDWIYKPNFDRGALKEDSLNSADDLPPIVLVHGIFGFGKGRLGGLSYFGGAEKKDDRVLVPDLGSLTSIYDRARELFYYLKGGQVDYGEEHNKACCHSQFGRILLRINCYPLIGPRWCPIPSVPHPHSKTSGRRFPPPPTSSPLMSNTLLISSLTR